MEESTVSDENIGTVVFEKYVLPDEDIDTVVFGKPVIRDEDIDKVVFDAMRFMLVVEVLHSFVPCHFGSRH